MINSIALPLRICQALFLIFFLEGAVRKWLSPGIGSIALVTGDLLAVTHILCMPMLKKHRPIGRMVVLAAAWFIIVLLWGFIQFFSQQSNVGITLIGLRFWLLYFVWALCAYQTVSKQQLFSLLKLIWLAAVCVTPLLILQYFSSPDAFVNKQVGDDVASVFIVSGDVVRVSGTFSFTFGFGIFCSLAIPLLLSPVYLNHSVTSSRPLGMVVGLICSFLFVLVSGSRGIWVYGAIVLLIYVGILVVPNSFWQNVRTGREKFIVTALMLPMFGMLVGFGPGFEAMQERVSSANSIEDPRARIFSIFVGEKETWETFTILGEGIGSGSNLGAVAQGKGRVFALAETEAGRVLLEGGLVGLIWLLSKACFSIAIIFVSLINFFRTGNALLLLLLPGFVLATLTWPASGQLQANFAWYFLAFLFFCILCDENHENRTV